MAGRARHPPFRLVFLLSLASLIPATSRAQPQPQPQPTPTPVTVGLIIDAASPVGRIASTTIPMALDDFYAAFPNASARVRVLQHDSGGDVVAAASAALQLMTTQGARAILGPQSSVESAFVAGLATRAQVPVVSFSATSPSVSPSAARFFSRAALSDAVQAGAIAALATHFGWRRVVPIYQDDDYGAAFVPFLADALAATRAEVPYRCALPAAASADAVAAAMYRLESQQTRAFVVHARPALAELVFAAAAEAGMMAEGYAWVITDGLTGLAGSVRPPQGVIGLAPHVPLTARLRDVRRRWARRFMRDHRDADPSQAEMGCYALWAYDAAWAVASAAERLGPGDLLSSPPGLVGGKSGGPTNFSGLGKSSSGEKFLAAIASTTFEGLGGRFELVDGELPVPAFQVVNIMDDGRGRGIGFWTRQHGLHRQLGHGATSGLAPVIWPSESTVVPVGWVQPTSGRKLQVAMPGASVDPGYRPILHLNVDPATNQTVAGGFVVEVFEAAVKLLPYALPFEYVLVGSMLYDTLVQKVGEGEFDAAVADITITANRSQLVDFTLPYMSSGISMVVPMRDQRSNRAWVFLKPLRYDLWLVSFFFFIFTGFVVSAVERRDNEEFRSGPRSNQIGTLLYFGFSTLVFAHRENLKSNLSRFVVVVWVFVVLILQSSYTASLTSMLTVPQLEPAIGDYASLWHGSEKVGIMNNSFMLASMTKSGFPPSRLVRYQSTQSFHEALLNGTIGAVVDETPYLRLFLKTYCDNFTQTAQTNKTGGFGFAFPKGSPYVADLSRAILQLTESDEMSAIERKWFGDADGCAAQGSPFTSDSLSFGSFWGLFLITGATSLLCCAAHLASFLWVTRHRIWEVASAPQTPWNRRLRMLLKLFDNRDLSSHTFRTKDGGGSVAGRSAADVGGASPGVVARIAAGTPLSVSNHTYISEWSLERASPAPAAPGDGEIQLAAGGEAGEQGAVAPNPDGSGDQNGTASPSGQ